MTSPYASHLGGQDPLDVIGATPERLRNLLAAMGAERAQQAPAPGKWCAREIVCHLADCEVAFAFRLRQTLAEDRHVMQPFDQEKWARQYDAYSAAEALAVFTALRGWNVALVRSLGPSDFGKVVNHLERGDMTFGTIVETMGGHDINHLKQMEAIAGRAAGKSS
jgi:DinB superfamily